LDFRAGTPRIRRTLIIIPMVTIGARTFTTILIPPHIHIITVVRTGTLGTGPITVIIAILITTVIELGIMAPLLADFQRH
jgi:hypothetical protein